LAVAAAAGILSLWLLAPSSRSTAADDKELHAGILKIAAAFEKKDKEGAQKMAVELGKKLQGKKPAIEMEELMHMFQLRSKKGLGAGVKAGAVMPDGIEKKVEALADKAIPAKQLGDEAQGLEEMSYHMAAIAAVAAQAPPIDKDMGKKKIKDWVKWSDDLRDASIALADAAKAKNGAGVKSAADKANTTCNKCHDVFRYDN